MAQAPEEVANRFPKHGKLIALPKGIPSESGKLTLFADFAGKMGDAKRGSVWLYLINATSMDLEVPTQDGDLSTKRESKGKDGEWRRCDTHMYSWCGNSYYSAKLAAKSFLAWQQPTNSADGKGEATPLRFHMYQQSPWNLTSNEGSGRVTKEELTLCRYDAMAMEYGPFEDVAAVATGKVVGGQGSAGGRSTAIAALRRFPTDKRVFPLLKEIVDQLPDLEPREANLRYGAVLEAWKSAEAEFDERWRFLADPIRHHTSISPAQALLALIYLPFSPADGQDTYQRNLRQLTDEILADPSHPALLVALNYCSKVFDKAGASLRLSQIMKDKRYGEAQREAARSSRERLLANPFIQVEMRNGDIVGGGKPTPLKWLKISNTSPRTVTLGENALVVEITVNEKKLPLRTSPFQLWLHGHPLTLKVGESVEWKNLTWWELVDPSCLKKGEYLSANFSVQIPELWEIPARPDYQFTNESADRILGLSDETPNEKEGAEQPPTISR
jgi:hypothetical protein